MKKTSYFGNRFQTALRGFRHNRRRRTEQKLAAALAAPEVSEFETLESRILLSSIGTGLNKRSVTFFDADGDKVTVKALGSGATFNIDLGGSTGDADIANIQINTNGASLGVNVAPVGSFTNPVQTKVIFNPNWDLSKIAGGDKLSLDGLTSDQKIQTQYFNLTPGYTNIGSITAAAGVTKVGSIGLTAAVVPVIDLAGVEVGNINLSTGQVSKVDAFMASNEAFFPDYGGWIPGLHNINLYDIEAKSITGINIAGINPSLYKAALGSVMSEGSASSSIVDMFSGNNYLGNITTDGGTTAGGIGRLTGTNSAFLGQISLNGANDFLGNTVINSWGSSAIISAAGNLTFTAKSFGGVLDVGGHLNIAFIDGFNGTINAQGGASGLRLATTDAIIVSNGTYGGQLLSEGNIADVILNNASFSGGTLEAANIGTIRFEGSSSSPMPMTVSAFTGSILASGNIEGLVVRNIDLTLGQGHLLVSAGDTLGLLDVANGNLVGSHSSGTIGEVIVRGGNLEANLVATQGGIGDVTVDLGRLTGTLFAKAGDIGDVTVVADSSASAIAGSIMSQSGSIGSIDVTNIGSGKAIGGQSPIYSYVYDYDTGYGEWVLVVPGEPSSTIFAQRDIATITAASAGATAIGLSNVTALGTLGPVSATAIGDGGPSAGAIDGLTLIAPTIGNINATSVAGTAIANSSFVSTVGAIGSITGSGRGGGLDGVTITAATDIGSVTGTAILDGSGISQSTITALEGNIGSVTGKTTSASYSYDPYYYSGGYGSGLVSVFISAAGNIDDVTGTAFKGDGINGGSVTSVAGDIGDITGKSSGVFGYGDGIYGLSVVALGGKIGNITGSTNSASGDGLDNLNVQALEGIATIKGSAAQSGVGIAGGTFTVSGPAGNIDSIVGNTNGGVGIGNGASFNAFGGTIGSIVASPSGPGGQAVNGASFTAGSLGNLSFVVSNLAGGDAVTNLSATALSGNIGAITVTNDSVMDDAHGISNSSITAVKGNIGAITVSTDGGRGDSMFSTGSFGIGNSDFSAAGNIGAISVTTTGQESDGITGGSTFVADNDGNGSGAIASVLVQVDGKGSNGISGVGADGSGATFAAQNITAASSGNSIQVLVTSPQGGTGILGGVLPIVFAVDPDTLPLLVDVAGDVGPITVTNSSKAAGANGIDGVKVVVDGNLGALTVTTVGGSAIVDSAFDVGGNIASLSATATDGDAIANSTFEAEGNIGPINAASTNGYGIFDSDFSAGGNIDTITATSTKGTAIYSTEFEAKGNIGNISATSQGTDGGDAIRFGDFKADGNIGTITATADEGSALVLSAFQAKGNIGAISAKSTSSALGDAIINSEFTADSDSNGSGDIGSITAVSETGRAIGGTGYSAPGVYLYSTFAGANIGNISAAVSGDGWAGIRYAEFTASKGNIGTIIASSLGTEAGDDAIDKATFSATGNIGDISATAKAGDGIWRSNFTADSDGDDSGDLGNITASSETGRAIAGVAGDYYAAIDPVFSIFSGANVGNIEATVSSEDGRDAIYYASFAATAGDIGTVTASTASNNGAFDALDSAYFYATGSIGNIEATAKAGDAFFFGGFFADTDGDGVGAIGNIIATTESGRGIASTQFNGASIGEVAATVTGDDGGTAISNSAFRAYAGSIGTIVANTSGDGGYYFAADAISNGTFLAFGDIGAVSATADGGRGIVSSTFQAGDNFGDPAATTDGSIGNVTATSAEGEAMRYATFRASANIGAVQATTSGDYATAIYNSVFAAGFDFGVATPPTAGNIGSITATANGENGSSFSNFGFPTTFSALGSIGNIEGTGEASSSIRIDAPTVGQITFKGMDAGNSASISFLNIASTTKSVGAVSVDGNLRVDGWDSLTRLGTSKVADAISVGGDLTGFFGTATIGDSADGLLMRGTANNNGGAALDGASHNVVFNIEEFGATPYSGTFEIDGVDYTDTSSAPFDGTPVNGVAVNLI